MGRIKFCGIMLIFIVTFCIWGLEFIDTKTGKLITVLETAEKYAENGDMEQALKTAEQLEELWEDYQDIASIFVRNDKISGAQASMTRLCSMIESESEELGAEFSNAHSCLEWIVESELPMIYNVL